MAGWFGPGSLYFAISLLYCVARVMRRVGALGKPSGAKSEEDVKPAWWLELNLDALAIYLGLTVILVWCLSVGLVNGWHASTFFGIAAALFGIACYYLACREERPADSTASAMGPAVEDPNLERWGAFLGLVYGLGLTLSKGLKGATNIYFTQEDYWDAVFLELGFPCDAAVPGGWDGGSSVAAHPKEFSKGRVSRSLWHYLAGFDRGECAGASGDGSAVRAARFLDRVFLQPPLRRAVPYLGGDHLSLSIREDPFRADSVPARRRNSRPARSSSSRIHSSHSRRPLGVPSGAGRALAGRCPLSRSRFPRQTIIGGLLQLPRGRDEEPCRGFP